jgi:hypothetical protein
MIHDASKSPVLLCSRVESECQFGWRWGGLAAFSSSSSISLIMTYTRRLYGCGKDHACHSYKYDPKIARLALDVQYARALACRACHRLQRRRTRLPLVQPPFLFHECMHAETIIQM